MFHRNGFFFAIVIIVFILLLQNWGQDSRERLRLRRARASALRPRPHASSWLRLPPVIPVHSSSAATAAGELFYGASLSYRARLFTQAGQIFFPLKDSILRDSPQNTQAGSYFLIKCHMLSISKFIHHIIIVYV